jgi:hypothetical protein
VLVLGTKRIVILGPGIQCGQMTQNDAPTGCIFFGLKNVHTIALKWLLLRDDSQGQLCEAED